MKLFATTALAVLFAFPSFAAPNCASVASVYSILMQKYGEARVVRGLSNRGYILELWANAETGTWTAVAIDPNGVACIADEGEAFEETDDPVGEPM